jgi:AcrR family transcriptional regulator
MNDASLLGMPYRRTPAVEQRQAQVRERLISEAAALVADGGWASCSISTVAARAGVATGTVYGYFANKADLLAEVFRSVSSREIAAALDVGQHVREDPNACACEVILATVGVFAVRAAQLPRLAYAVIAEPVDVAVDVERLAFRRAWTDLLAVAVREGVERGQLPVQDAHVTAGALLGAVAEVLVQPLAAGAVDAGAYAGVVQSLLSFTRRCLGGDHEHHA